MPITKKHDMTPREIFVYIATCFHFSPIAQTMGVDRRTAILEELRKEYCPSVDDNDWLVIMREIASNHKVVEESIFKLIKRDDLTKIYFALQERWSKRK